MTSLLTKPLLWYATKLDTHPIMTKSITSGLISAGGDLLCQRIHRRRRPRQATKEGYEPIGGGEKGGSDDGRHHDGYDWTRTLRFGIIGSCLVAPTVNFWYGMLMTRIPGQTIGATATRLFLDQGCFAPFFTAVFISTLTVLERVTTHLPWDAAGSGGSAVKADHDSPEHLAGHITTRLREDLPQAIVVGWGIWVPSMAVMFRYVPGKYQVLYSNVIAFAWNGYLSWRTHEAEEHGDDEDCGDGTSRFELEGAGGASPRSVFNV